MAHLLLIDDDPELILEKVSHVFPAPAHRIESVEQQTVMRCRALSDFCHDPGCPGEQAGMDGLTPTGLLGLVLRGTRHLFR